MRAPEVRRSPESDQMSLAQYLAESEFWDVRHEWVNGRVRAVGATDPEGAVIASSPLHAAVAANALLALGSRLRGSRCRAVGGDQRVHVVATGALLHPDVTVVRGRYEFAPGDRLAVTNPIVVVQVHSPSTHAHDLGVKKEHCLRIPSLQHLLLVDPASRSVAHYRRVEGGWFLAEQTEGQADLPAIEVSLPIAELFADLENVGEGA